MGCVATRRRARLRTFAKSSKAGRALQLLVHFTGSSVDLLRSNGDADTHSTNDAKSARQHRELLTMPDPGQRAGDLFRGCLPVCSLAHLDTLVRASAVALNYMQPRCPSNRHTRNECKQYYLNNVTTPSEAEYRKLEEVDKHALQETRWAGHSHAIAKGPANTAHGKQAGHVQK